MKKGLYIIICFIVGLTSCDNSDDVAIFDKTADERVAEAIAALKEDLVDADNGWKLKYRPQEGAGSFYVLMDFNEDNTVTIKTDLGVNDGEYFEQTVTYRIDSSLGLELIIETYSFFSLLFEQDNASFLAEYEFNFVNRTPDGALVFNSKTDPGVATILLFEEASATDDALLGTTLSTNLNILGEDFNKFSSTLKLTYENKDLEFYMSVDNFKRIATITTAARKSNSAMRQNINFTSPYIIKGDSIVFDSRLSGNLLGTSVNLKGIKLSTISESTINVCDDPITLHAYAGVTSANDVVSLETTLLDASGPDFTQAADYFNSGVVLLNGVQMDAQIAEDLTGYSGMQLYYNYDIGGSSLFYALGFYLINASGDVTFALREFTPTLDGNNLIFDFAPEISIFGDPNPDANVDNGNQYLEALTDGGTSYVFKINENVYELYNPCTGWSMVFVAGN